MKPKIYDCFCYYNEDMLLKLRLDTLWEQVDYFVLCESVLTISGQPKPLYFDPFKFEKYQSKIRHLVVRDYPFETNDAWRNERFQRNFLVNGLFDAQDQDLILVSDVDEIPNPELLKNYDASRYLRGDFEQRGYAYFLNNLNVKNGKPVPWFGSKITTYGYFKKHFLEIERVRNTKFSGLFKPLKKLYFKNFQVQTIKQGGWHFTWIGNFQRIIQKLEGFAHQEFNKPEYKNPQVIEAKIRNGEDILLREGFEYEMQPLNAQFPEALINNLDFYKQWLIEK